MVRVLPVTGVKLGVGGRFCASALIVATRNALIPLCDRVEELECALRKLVAMVEPTPHAERHTDGCAWCAARAALEGKP